MLLSVLFLLAVIIISNFWSELLIIQEHLAMSGEVWRYSGCHTWWGVIGIHWVEAGDAAEHPQMHRQPLFPILQHEIIHPEYP